MVIHSSEIRQPDVEGPLKYASPKLRMLAEEIPSPDQRMRAVLDDISETHRLDQRRDYDEEPPSPVNLEKLAEDTVKNPLKDLARDIKALVYDDMVEFARGVCPTDMKPHEVADRISAWAGGKLNVSEETPPDGEKIDAVEESRQDARESDLGKQEV